MRKIGKVTFQLTFRIEKLLAAVDFTTGDSILRPWFITLNFSTSTSPHQQLNEDLKQVKFFPLISTSPQFSNVNSDHQQSILLLCQNHWLI